MATPLELKLSLEGMDTPEAALYELKDWLEKKGIRVELEYTSPTETELGGKPFGLRIMIFATALSLTAEFAHLPPEIEEALQATHEWKTHRQEGTLVLEPTENKTSTENKTLDEEIQKKIRRERWDIVHRRPEIPPRGGENKI